MRRLALTSLLAILAVLMMAGPALAQAYPPDSGTVSCGASSAQAGSSFSCSADGFKPNSSVTLTCSGATTDNSTWENQSVGTASAEGVVSSTCSVADDATGPVSVSFSGVDASDQVRVLSANAAVNVVAQPDGGTSPTTGGEFGPALLAVLVLLGVGGGLLLVTRRKRANVEA